MSRVSDLINDVYDRSERYVSTGSVKIALIFDALSQSRISVTYFESDGHSEMTPVFKRRVEVTQMSFVDLPEIRSIGYQRVGSFEWDASMIVDKSVGVSMSQLVSLVYSWNAKSFLDQKFKGPITVSFSLEILSNRLMRVELAHSWYDEYRELPRRAKRSYHYLNSAIVCDSYYQSEVKVFRAYM